MRMNKCLMGLPAAPDEFLRAYEGKSGHTVENLGIWEMAAAVRPMIDPEACQMDREITAGSLQQFMEEAIKRN